MASASHGVGDPVLRRHDAQVGDQVALTALQRAVGRPWLEPAQIRGVRDDEHIRGSLPSARAGHVSVGSFVEMTTSATDIPRRSSIECQAVHQSVVRPKLANEELWREVVMVEDEARSAPPGGPCRVQEEVRWSAGVHGVERAVADQLAHESPRLPESPAVLHQIPDHSTGREPGGIAVDLDALTALEADALRAIVLRADDGDLGAGGDEAGADVPHAPVTGDGLVLAHDDDTRPAVKDPLAPSPHCSPDPADRPARAVELEYDFTPALASPHDARTVSWIAQHPGAVRCELALQILTGSPPLSHLARQRSPPPHLRREEAQELVIDLEVLGLDQVVGMCDQVDQATVLDQPLGFRDPRPTSRRRRISSSVWS